MPDFLGWHRNEQTNEIGALIQLNAHTFKPMPNGMVNVVSTPRTEVFSGEQIARMVDVAGPKSKAWWEGMNDAFLKHKPLLENSQDLTVATVKPADLKNDLKPGFTPTMTV